MIRNFLVLLIFCIPSILSSAIYDCFTFFNELELLKVRFAELYDVVDYFVLVEAKKTFSGNDKPLYFKDNAHLFSQYRDKIIHIIIEDFPIAEGNTEKNNWAREEYQRNAILWGLTHCQPEDIVMVSDADEIVTKRVIENVQAFYIGKKCSGGTLWSRSKENQNALICQLTLKLYLFFLNCQSKNDWFWSVKAAPYWVVQALSPHGLRIHHFYHTHLYTIDDAGWHFSSMGGMERFLYKLNSISTSFAEVGTTLSTFRDVLNRNIDELKDFYLKDCFFTGIDDSYPLYIRDNKAYFQSLGWIQFE